MGRGERRKGGTENDAIMFCVVFNYHRGNFTLQQMETSTENQNQSKFRVVGPVPVYVATKDFYTQGNIVEERVENCKSQKMEEFAATLCL